MDTRTQMLCAWCGIAGLTLFIVGFWFIGGFVPPPSPNHGALWVQRFYMHHTDLKRVGLVLTMIAGTMTAPWVAVISTQLKRIEGHYSPLAYTQLGLGMLGVLLFLFPAMLMEAAAFRPNRDPQLILLLNDAAWLPLIGAFAPAVFQGLAIALAVFKDKQEKVFPRWLGWFNIWVVLLFLPAALIYFFKHGPFAWNGLFPFWLALSVFGAWFGVMFVMLRRAIHGQAAERQDAVMAEFVGVAG